MSEYCVHGEDGGRVKPIVLSGDIVDEVEDQFEEGTLVEGSGIELVELVDHHEDGVAYLLEVDAPVGRYYLKEDYYQFGVLVDIPVIDGLGVGG